jgi:hypothetical protein
LGETDRLMDLRTELVVIGVYTFGDAMLCNVISMTDSELIFSHAGTDGRQFP